MVKIKKNILIFILFFIPSSIISMEQEGKPYDKEKEMPSVANWYRFPCEIKLFILSYLINTKHIMSKITAKEDEAISEFFKHYGTLKLVDKNTNNLLEDDFLFDLNKTFEHWVAVYRAYFFRKLPKSAEKGWASFLELALNNGLLVNHMPKDLLSIASKAHHIEFCEKLILAGIFEGVSNTPLIHAIFLHNHRIIKSLINNGKAYALFPDFSTELMAAVETNDIETCKLLIASSTINAKNNSGENALIIAARVGNREIVQLLLDKKVNINEVNNKGETALMIAAVAGHLELVEFLIERGASLDIKDTEDGATVLLKAIDTENMQMIKLLATKGANINAADLRGFTPLIVAVQKYNTELIKLFLDKGADMHAANERNETALSMATKYPDPEIMEIFKKHLKKLDIEALEVKSNE